MGTKVSCDLCKEFIAEYGPASYGAEGGTLNKPFIISSCYEGKSLIEEGGGWLGERDKISFWACKTCNKKFMDGVRKLVNDLGLDKESL